MCALNFYPWDVNIDWVLITKLSSSIQNDHSKMDKRVFDTHLRKTLKIVIPNCDGILLNTTEIYKIASSIIAPRREVLYQTFSCWLWDSICVIISSLFLYICFEYCRQSKLLFTLSLCVPEEHDFKKCQAIFLLMHAIIIRFKFWPPVMFQLVTGNYKNILNWLVNLFESLQLSA